MIASLDTFSVGFFCPNGGVFKYIQKQRPTFLHLIINVPKNTSYRLDFSASKRVCVNFAGFLKLNTL